MLRVGLALLGWFWDPFLVQHELDVWLCANRQTRVFIYLLPGSLFDFLLENNVQHEFQRFKITHKHSQKVEKKIMRTVSWHDVVHLATGNPFWGTNNLELV